MTAPGLERSLVSSGDSGFSNKQKVLFSVIWESTGLMGGSAEVGWMPWRFVVDTGASINVISEKTAKRIARLNREDCVFSPTGVSFSLADGTLARAKSMLRTTIYFPGREGAEPLGVATKFLVAKIKVADMILGLPFLKATRAIVSLEDWTLSLRPKGCTSPTLVSLEAPPPKRGPTEQLNSTVTKVPSTDLVAGPFAEELSLDLSVQQGRLRSLTNDESPVLQGSLAVERDPDWKIMPTLNALEIKDTLHTTVGPTDSLAAKVLDEPLTGGLSFQNGSSNAYSNFLQKELSSVRSDIRVGPRVKRKVEHHIEFKPGCKPRPMRPYRENAADTKFLREFVDDFLKAGLLTIPKTDEFASPVVVVPKKDGGRRICCDYRLINEVTVRAQYPLPNISDLFATLSGTSVFSKVDLEKGFYQVQMAEADIPKTAFRTSFGLYAWNVMPMGLSNSPATFQRLMDSIFGGYEFIVCYLDDILIFSRNEKEHVDHLRKFFQLIRSSQLVINRSKCEFFRKEVEFLGHTVSKDKIHMQPSKLKAISDWPVPRSRKQLQSFLGLCNYYRSFISNYSSIATPLTNLTSKSVPFAFKEDAIVAFNLLKQSLNSAEVLAIFDPEKECILQTDASLVGVGGVLLQPHGDSLRPVEHYSAKLSKAATRYPTHERELLAIVESVRHFRHYLGGKFTILTDHRTLTNLDSPSAFNSTVNGRLTRWREYLSAFDFEIKYLKGELNPVADALSRKYEDMDPEAFFALKVFDQTVPDKDSDEGLATVSLISDDGWDNHVPLEKAQEDFRLLQDDGVVREWIGAQAQDDPIYVDIRQKCESSVEGRHRDFTVDKGVLSHKGRLFVPRDPFLRERILSTYHNLFLHEGGEALNFRIARRFFWPNMEKSVADFCKTCYTCGRIKQQNVAAQGPMLPLPTPHRPMLMLSLDFVTGMPRTLTGYDAILTITDKFSKFKFLRPASTSWTSEDVFTVLSRVFHEHGWPRVLVSDRDPRFTSETYKLLMEANGVQLAFSTANHPQTDGQSEITNKVVMDRLRAAMARDGTTENVWDNFLPYIQKTLNETPSSVTGLSPNLIRFGFELEDPRAADSRLWTSKEEKVESVRDFYLKLDSVASRLERNRRDQSHTQKRPLFQKHSYHPGDYVFVKLPTNAADPENEKTRYQGPFLVKAVGPNYVKIVLRDTSVHDSFNVDKVKPATRSSRYTNITFDKSKVEFTHLSLDNQDLDPARNRACFYLKGKDIPISERYIASRQDLDLTAAALNFLDSCYRKTRKSLVESLDLCNSRRLSKLNRNSDEALLRREGPTVQNSFLRGQNIPEEEFDPKDDLYDPQNEPDGSDSADSDGD